MSRASTVWNYFSKANLKQTLKQMRWQTTVWMLMNQKQYSRKLLNAVLVHEQYIALKGTFLYRWKVKIYNLMKYLWKAQSKYLIADQCNRTMFGITMKICKYSYRISGIIQMKLRNQYIGNAKNDCEFSLGFALLLFQGFGNNIYQDLS